MPNRSDLLQSFTQFDCPVGRHMDGLSAMKEDPLAQHLDSMRERQDDLGCILCAGLVGVPACMFKAGQAGDEKFAGPRRYLAQR